MVLKYSSSGSSFDGNNKNNKLEEQEDSNNLAARSSGVNKTNLLIKTEVTPTILQQALKTTSRSQKVNSLSSYPLSSQN